MTEPMGVARQEPRAWLQKVQGFALPRERVPTAEFLLRLEPKPELPRRVLRGQDAPKLVEERPVRRAQQASQPLAA
jgi:hypothetical protein